MSRSDKIRLLAFGMLIVVILSSISTRVIKKQMRLKELSYIGHYPLYTTYDTRYNAYHVFVMINAQTDSENELISWAKQIITEEYINNLRTNELYQTYGDASIMVYLVSTSKEMPFGWEKSDLNIEMNFDISAFYRNSHAVVEIPIYAENFNRCRITFRNT